MSGSVGDGPVVNANIAISTIRGAVIVEGQSDSAAEYDVLVDAQQSDYPLLIASNGGTDLVSDRSPDFSLLGVATNPGQSTTANVNPYGTLSVEIAGELAGGLSSENVNTAKSIIDSSFDFGLVSLTTDGAMYSEITSDNVADIVRASESMGEAIRRTRDKLSAAGYGATGDSVVAAISSDLTDGQLDGVGGSRTEARISAVMVVVAAEVLLEAMQNELRVYGIPASAAMDNAAVVVTGTTPSIATGDLPVTASMRRLAMTGVEAAMVASSDPRLLDILSALTGLQAGASASLADSLIRDDYRTVMGNLTDLVAASNNSTIAAINDVAGGRTSTDSSLNRAPSISGNPVMSVTAGQAYSFQPMSSDPDGDNLSFSVANAPPWTEFNTSTGRLAGSPGDNDVGTYAGIRISVSDGSLSNSLAPFTLTVNSTSTGNATPTISGQPNPVASVGANYTFLPTAADADGDTLSFSVINLPFWASFNPNNGLISGTPSSSDVGTYTGVRVSVSDGSAMAMLPAFDITVQVSNSAPTISGAAPSSVNVNEVYAFTPTAADADGDALSFSIVGLPSWAEFNSSTGRISGTPSQADLGSYSNIVISVTDGIDTTSLTPFSITVNAVSLGSATLSWTAPTQNDDGTALTDLAGYRIYWGTSSGAYTNSVTINDPSATTFVVENLSPGTYEFVSTAFNTSGVESRFSTTAMKTIQ
ncbi:MAG: putative Ig domain-containing protein [Pseudomonadota bacterium]